MVILWSIDFNMFSVVLNFLNKSLGVYTVSGMEIEPTYWEAGAIVILIFLLILTLARLRYIYIEWHFSRHNLSFLFYGFLLALILEGFLLLSGRTFLTATLGWKNAPKPISTALDAGREKLIKVLAAQDQIPDSVAKESVSPNTVISNYESLPFSEREVVKSSVCEP